MSLLISQRRQSFVFTGMWHIQKMITAFILLSLLFVGSSIADTECLHRDYGNGATVCVCNAEHCDTISPIEQLPAGQFVHYTSNQKGLRFNKETGEFISSSSVNAKATIDHSATYQSILGFGGCFTDATGQNFNNLKGEARDNIMKSYFSEDGIGYNIGRVPIGSTDFGDRGYSYLDTPYPDHELANFALQPEDFEYKIPVIKEAMTMTEDEMILIASAWTAPKWMKTNGEFAGLGFLIREFYQLWADYKVRFLEEYQQQGLEFWGITTGNEPSLALPFIEINTVGWSPWDMNVWIRRHFGPTLRNSAYSDIKIIAHDDQRISLPFVHWILDGAEARGYVDGIGVHWYWDRFAPASWLTHVHEHFPEKFILGTEASAGSRPWEAAVVLGSWDRGQDYAEDIILDLQNWMTGWIDWCMALNEEGGPSYISNFVDSPVIVNATSNEFYKQPSFYAMGHFSKFLPRGSVKIDMPDTLNDLLLVAFDRPDGGTFVGIVNREERDLAISIYDEQRGYMNLEITAKSFNSIVYW